jgi:hypothetical protein
MGAQVTWATDGQPTVTTPSATFRLTGHTRSGSAQLLCRGELMDRSTPDPATLESLHAVAEHVVAAALYAETGRIGLRVSPGGFSTPPFGAGQTVGVEEVDIVVASPTGTRRAQLTTLGQAAEVADVTPGAPVQVYTPATPNDPDAPLVVDPVSARAIAAWHALGDDALRRWATALAPAAPTAPTLWPEHFDVAIEVDAITYGASPGDDYSAHPYLYVSVAANRRSPDRFWNAPFGASLPWDDVTGASDAVRFFQAGHSHLVP